MRRSQPRPRSLGSARYRRHDVRVSLPFTMAELHDTTEEYLETILAIEEEGVVPLRARLVERLGLSAAAVSETVGRLSDHGYVELHDDRTPAPHDEGPHARDHRRAPPPSRRTPPHRRHRPRVGEGAPRSRPVGARDLGRRRGEARRAARRSGHVPARQPDSRLEARDAQAADDRAGARRARPDHRGAHQREARALRRRPEARRRLRASCRDAARRSSTTTTTACT